VGKSRSPVEDTLRRWPDESAAQWYQFANVAFYGDPGRALKMMNESPDAFGLTRDDRACYRTFLEARARNGRGQLNGVLKDCVSWGPDSNTVMRMLAALGDSEGAYRIAQHRTFMEAESTISLFYPEMAALRADARFMPLLAKSGLLEYWIKTGQWPDFCGNEALTYGCKAAANRAVNNNGRDIAAH
jgi:hypothetical protein